MSDFLNNLLTLALVVGAVAWYAYRREQKRLARAAHPAAPLSTVSATSPALLPPTPPPARRRPLFWRLRGLRICSACESIGRPKKQLKGGLLGELAAVVLLIPPFTLFGILMEIWRVSGPTVCRRCRNGTMIPFKSPAGRRLMAAGGR